MSRLNGQTPTLVDLFDESKRNIFDSMNCVKIGNIVSFNATKKTAEVQILFKRNTSKGIVSLPKLVDVPVFTLQGGTGSIQMPIQAGDACLVLFSDRDIDSWFLTGSESLPRTERTHDLSDGIAIVGLNSRVSSIPDYDTNLNINIPSGKKLVVKSTGSATFEALGTQALALLSELSSLVSTYNSHTHTDPQGGVTGAPAQQASTPTGTTKLKGA